MLPFVDVVSPIAAVLGVAGIAWFARVAARIPGGSTFVCTPQPPRFARTRLVIPGYAASWLLGIGLWIGGRIAGDQVLHFFGMITLLGVAAALLPTTALFARQLARGVHLQVTPGERPGLVLRAGDERREVALTPGCVRAWTVGNGLSGPMYLQLACGPDAATGVALFVVPALRQWQLADGAAWRNAYTGVCPVARGAELLDLLAPYTTPGDDLWRPR